MWYRALVCNCNSTKIKRRGPLPGHSMRANCIIISQKWLTIKFMYGFQAIQLSMNDCYLSYTIFFFKFYKPLQIWKVFWWISYNSTLFNVLGNFTFFILVSVDLHQYQNQIRIFHARWDKSLLVLTLLFRNLIIYHNIHVFILNFILFVEYCSYKKILKLDAGIYV